mmetsp:Transcript_7173/g.12866  ORF Transcript_7173/g.12866 Transcript_7173/m.12866 type:complete len:320 (-) Transcript_7173:713-1672(-)
MNVQFGKGLANTLACAVSKGDGRIGILGNSMSRSNGSLLFVSYNLRRMMMLHGTCCCFCFVFQESFRQEQVWRRVVVGILRHGQVVHQDQFSLGNDKISQIGILDQCARMSSNGGCQAHRLFQNGKEILLIRIFLHCQLQWLICSTSCSFSKLLDNALLDIEMSGQVVKEILGGLSRRIDSACDGLNTNTQDLVQGEFTLFMPFHQFGQDRSVNLVRELAVLIIMVQNRLQCLLWKRIHGFPSLCQALVTSGFKGNVERYAFNNRRFRKHGFDGLLKLNGIGWQGHRESLKVSSHHNLHDCFQRKHARQQSNTLCQSPL